MSNQHMQDAYAEYPVEDDYDFGVNGSDIDETYNYAPFPAGRYRLMATRVQLKDPRSGSGKMVAVEFQVVDGPHQGRKVFENYNLQHHNHQTVEIAQRQVKQWLIACGMDASQRLTMNLLRGLEGAEFSAHVAVEQDKSGRHGDQNRIKRYEAPNGGGSPAPAQRQPPQQAAPARQQPPQHPAQRPVAGGQQPWRR